jgi:hypothetical protein
VITLAEIEQNVLDCNTAELSENMIGAAFLWNPEGGQHAAIFLVYNGEAQVFHFTGRDKEVIIEPISPTENYYYKSLDFLEPVLLPAFLAQCELILENAKPQFGYFYEGSLYNEKGEFKSPNDSPEYMTCVGFCINVIKGFLADSDFFNYEDWDEATLDGKMDHVEAFLVKVKQHNPDVNIDSFKANLRRITPAEYLAGAFSDTTPITKNFTNSIIGYVERVLESKKVA